MAFTPDQVAAIFTRTSGRCHLCRGTLALANYGKNGRRGAWEVDHSVPRAKGGTDRLNNLAPACIGCNRSKRDGSTRRVRQANGFTRKPMSPEEKDKVRGRNGLIGLGVGAVTGLLVAGPPGAFLCALSPPTREGPISTGITGYQEPARWLRRRGLHPHFAFADTRLRAHAGRAARADEARQLRDGAASSPVRQVLSRSSIPLLLRACLSQSRRTSSSVRTEDGTTSAEDMLTRCSKSAILNIEPPGPRALGDSVIVVPTGPGGDSALLGAGLGALPEPGP